MPRHETGHRLAGNRHRAAKTPFVHRADRGAPDPVIPGAQDYASGAGGGGRSQSQRRAMKISRSVALVTGANRGLGKVYTRELVARGAGKVYGAARNPSAVTEPGVTPIALDITDPDR